MASEYAKKAPVKHGIDLSSFVLFNTVKDANRKLTFYCTYFTETLSWSIKQPSEVHKGSPVTLEWTVSLTTEETLRAHRFSLILLEREMFLYSNRWLVMVVKQFSGGVHQEIGNQDTFDVIPGNDLSIRLHNVTDTDATRFRCTFFSSFAAPKSVVQVDIKGEPMCIWRLQNGGIKHHFRKTSNVNLPAVSRLYTNSIIIYLLKSKQLSEY